MKMKICHLGLDSACRLQTENIKLWVVRVVQMHYSLFAIDQIRTFQATDHGRFVKSHSITIHRLLSDGVLYGLRERGTGERPSFVPIGTPYTPSE